MSLSGFSLILEEQQLRHDHVRHVVVDRADEEDDAALEEARIDVVGTLAARRLLDDHRHEVETLGLDEVDMFALR